MQSHGIIINLPPCKYTPPIFAQNLSGSLSILFDLQRVRKLYAKTMICTVFRNQLQLTMMLISAEKKLCAKLVCSQAYHVLKMTDPLCSPSSV